MDLFWDNYKMKWEGKWQNLVFIIVTIMLCLFPIYGKLIDCDYQMSGVSSVDGDIPTDFESLWTGVTSSSMETKLKDNVPGRVSLIRLHSQYMYSVFNSSSNSNVVIGDNHSLYEPEYLCDFLNLWPKMSEDSQIELIDKLKVLQELLAQKGKKLYVFITPSKVRYDYSNIPWFYRAFTNPQLSTNYDGFIRKLENSSINYFDSIGYINENISDEKIFYSSGIHWSNGAAAQVTAALLEDMKKDTGYDLGSLSVNLVDSDSGIAPDQDLLSTLNLYTYTKEDTYRIPEFNYIPGTDHPSVLIRGGSFMGQTLSKLIDLNVFGSSVYFQNNIVIDNKTNTHVLSDFNAYEEIDVTNMVNTAELVVLEVNEEKIWIMGWGFIDELIDSLQSEGQENDIQLVGQKNLATDINPWGVNLGYIDYGDRDGVVITTPEDTMVKLNVQGKGKTLSFDAEIHEWVREYSDGCTLLVKMTGSQTEEIEYIIPGANDDNAVVHVTLPIEDIDQVSISYFTPEKTTPDCDWVVISNINME